MDLPRKNSKGLEMRNTRGKEERETQYALGQKQIEIG